MGQSEACGSEGLPKVLLTSVQADKQLLEVHGDEGQNWDIRVLCPPLVLSCSPPSQAATAQTVRTGVRFVLTFASL